MMAPRSRPMAMSWPRSETERPERSRISTWEPSRRRSIAHFDVGAIAEAQYRAGIAGGADVHSGGYFGAADERKRAGIGDAIDESVGGFDHGFGAAERGTEAVAKGPEGEAGGGYDCRGYRPAECGNCGPRAVRFCGWWLVAGGWWISLQRLVAGHAFMRVILQE